LARDFWEEKELVRDEDEERTGKKRELVQW